VAVPGLLNALVGLQGSFRQLAGSFHVTLDPRSAQSTHTGGLSLDLWSTTWHRQSG
jgi:hypothetical protein